MKMEKRISSNSSSLRAAFPEEYYPLYYASDIVTSAAGSFYWCGEHIVLYGSPVVIQKLPLRAYVGLRRSNDPGVRFQPWNVYNGLEQNFFQGYIPAGQKSAMAKVLNPLLPTLIESPGLEVSSLFEMHPAVGLNSSGAMSAALATGIFLLAGRLKPKDLNAWKIQPLRALLRDEMFNQVFRLAWKLDAAISGGYSSGSATFASLISARYPIVYWTGMRSESDGYPRGGTYPVYVAEKWDSLDSIPIFAARLDEIYDIPVDRELPIDYGLIFSGRTRFTNAATADVSMKRRQNIDQYAASLASLATKQIESSDFKSALSLSMPDARQAWWESILVLGSAIVSAMIDGLQSNLLSADSETLDRLVDQINQYNKFLYYIGAGNEFLEAETAEVRWYIENRWHSKVGVKIIGAGQGGDLLFVFPHAFEYSSPDDLLVHLREKFGNPKINIDYMSWTDGIGEQKGVTVDYSYELDIVPPNLRGLYVLNTFGKQRGTTLVPYTSLEDRAREFDLAVIGVPRKQGVWVRGREAKFKMGKQTAVEIFRKLLLEDRPILSTELGSYEKKAEFVAALINPLNEMLRREVGRELPIIVRERKVADGGGFDVMFHDDPELKLALLWPLETE
jgi:hypothetical protein